MRTVVFIALALLVASPAVPADASQVLTKEGVATAVGDPIQDVQVDGTTIARYYAVNGTWSHFAAATARWFSV
jgi:hypothetical protein